MAYETPEMVKVTVVLEKDVAIGPENCSGGFNGCCWKD